MLLLLLLGGLWDQAAAEAVAMAIQCGAEVSTCDSKGNTAIAAAIAVAIATAACPSMDPVDNCTPSLPSLEIACLRLLRDGGSAAVPRHAHIQLQQEVAAPLEQQPLLMTCIQLGWRQLALVLVSQVPLHPAKQLLLEMCR